MSENPFNVNPDPRYLYLTAQTREALDELTYGIQARKGLILLTGEVGTGKTTLINRVLDWLHQQQTPTAFIFNSHLETRHLFDFILADFGVPFDSRWKGNALMCLNLWLIQRYRAGQVPVLIVDEAQGLSTDVLEEIRMLLNLENAHEKLLQIVLAGQPELDDRLKRPELRQLKQRIVLRCRTTALTREETHDYIQARLHIAGANGKPVFASQSMDAVHFYSRGIPRVTNLLCEHALINAYVDGVRPVPVQIIDEIAREFQLDDIQPLAPSIDSVGAVGAAMISSRSVFANAPEPQIETAKPLLEENLSGMAICVAPGCAAAHKNLARAKGITIPDLNCEVPRARTESQTLDVSTSVPTAPECGWMGAGTSSGSAAIDSGDAMELIAQFAMERAPSASAPFLHVVKAREKLDPSTDSSRCQVAGRHNPAYAPTTDNATRSDPVNPRLEILLGLCLSFLHWSARSRKRFVSAVNSPAWLQTIAILRSRRKRLLQSVHALRLWRLARRDGRRSAARSRQWLRLKASVLAWLRRPFKPVQWRLPYSWPLETRRRLTQKRM
ncbi:MAG TPA: AAA family ATPase [Candidatus Dormibacteraeota bacterium]|nr:AAA family ATPase [Candidatus Dormibacteraeota bacterium]